MSAIAHLPEQLFRPNLNAQVPRPGDKFLKESVALFLLSHGYTPSRHKPIISYQTASVNP